MRCHFKSSRKAKIKKKNLVPVLARLKNKCSSHILAPREKIVKEIWKMENILTAHRVKYMHIYVLFQDIDQRKIKAYPYKYSSKNASSISVHSSK